MDSATPSGGLAPELLAWIAEVGRGQIVRLERHLARREAWIIDVRRADGSLTELFVRVDRARGSAESERSNPQNLRKETRVIAALADTPVPVPAVYGWSEALHCAVLQRVPGRADLHCVGPAQQRPVFEHFMRILAELHRLEPRSLSLDELPLPTTGEQCALREVERFAATMGRGVVEPLLSFALRWLRAHAPALPERISLVQGDTGPANFLFQDERVTAVVDWELAHFGDPMEDLGNVCVREFYHPSGNLAELFRLYEKHSGIPLDLGRVRYFRVENNTRACYALLGMTARADPRGPLALNLAYRYIQERGTAESLAEAMGVELERPAFPAAPPAPPTSRHEQPSLGEVLVEQLRRDVLPAVSDPFARQRAEHAALLAACLDRRARLGPAVERVELDEIGALLGRSFADLDQALLALDVAIRAGRAGDDAEVLRYLARRCYRAEALHAPVVALYPGRVFSSIE
jgi:aminoglycoside phosphotransferase (APT) family kinase protein